MGGCQVCASVEQFVWYAAQDLRDVIIGGTERQNLPDHAVGFFAIGVGNEAWVVFGYAVEVG